MEISAIRNINVPEKARNWLLDPDSLTHRLRCICQDSFNVRVCRQTWARPMPSERGLLSQRHDRYAKIREVHLICKQVPWVFARTVMPLATLRGATRRLAFLGSRPLGALLFADRSWERRLVQIARICHGQRLYNEALAGSKLHPAAIWGRRSLYYLNARHGINTRLLLVNEVFLPPAMDQSF